MSDEGYNDDLDWDNDTLEDDWFSLSTEAKNLLDKINELDDTDYKCKIVVFDKKNQKGAESILPYLTNYAKYVNYKTATYTLPFAQYSVEVSSTLN